MNYIFILYSILLAIFFVYCGLGLALLLTPKKLSRYAWILSPFIGLAYLGFFSWWSIHLFHGGVNAFKYPLVVLPAILLIAAIITKKELILSIPGSLNQKNISLILLSILVFTIVSLPCIFLLNSPNALVIGNNDIISYATESKYLVTASLIDQKIGVDPQILNLIENNNFGAFIAAAVPSSLFGIPTYMLENILLILFFVFSLIVLYVIAVEIFKFKSYLALLLLFLAGINFNLIYIIYTGFVGQVIGEGMFLALLLVVLSLLFNCDDATCFRSYVPLTAVLMFGLIMAYSPLIFVFCVPISIYLLYLAISKKSIRSIFLPLKFFLVSLVICFIAAPSLLINKINELIYFSRGAAAGWYMPPVTPEQIVGLVGNDLGWLPIQNGPWELQPVPLIIRLILSVIVLGIGYFSLKYLFNKEKNLFFISCALLFTFFVIFSYYEIISLSFPIVYGNEYKAYKLVTYGLPLILLILLSGFNEVNVNIFKNGHRFYSVLLLILIAGNVWSCGAMMNMTLQKSYPIKSSVLATQELNSLPNITSINIEEKSYTDQMWIYYFLFMDKEVHLKYTTYFKKSPLTGEWTLKNSDKNSDILNISDVTGIIHLNSDYNVVSNRTPFMVTFKEGWYEPERDGNYTFRWTGNNNQTPRIEIENVNMNMDTDISLNYKPLIQNNTFSVSLDNTTIMNCNDKKFCQISNVIIKPGIHELTFDSQYMPRSPGPGDNRTLGYAFYTISLTNNNPESGELS